MFVILAVGADIHGRHAVGSERESRGKVGSTFCTEERRSRERTSVPSIGAIRAAPEAFFRTECDSSDSVVYESFLQSRRSGFSK